MEQKNTFYWNNRIVFKGMMGEFFDVECETDIFLLTYVILLIRIQN